MNRTLILTIVVLALAVYVIGGYIKSINKSSDEQRTMSASTEVQSIATYEVKAGDSLWKIAKDAYGDGYAWTKIYEENKQVIGSNPSLIEKGMKITLPKVEEKKPVEVTVQKGGTLWGVAQQVCGDGFQWVKIAFDNGVVDARRIEPGLKLKVQCRQV